MKIKKVYNNNVILTENEQGQEMVVMGRGLAFGQQKGDVVHDDKVEKTFVLEDHAVSEKLAELLKDVPEKFLELSEQIISMAKQELGVKLDDYLYVALTDHLNFALHRHKQGLRLQNALSWEIRKYYRAEFDVALKALDIIREETGMELEEDEAASITLHLVNSQMSGEKLDSIVQVVTIVNDLLTIVKYHFGIELDEKSLNYERFVTHLRFFAWRLIRNERASYDTGDDFLFNQVKQQYRQAYECSRKMAAYVENTYEWTVSKDEMIYLTVHVHRVTSRATME
ncbi:BglG family transcription antiterminator LicT [Salibacterium lacus]|uniref:BglG family transcription antiterminator LicT n=1 Tax=Salibacterium lacus TaxID=1898109 RepID=A0ABW5T8E9_9BACI